MVQHSIAVNDDSSDDSDGTLTYELDKTNFNCSNLGGTSVPITPTFIGNESQNTRLLWWRLQPKHQ